VQFILPFPGTPGMLRRLDLRFRFSQVVLKGRARQQFADDRLPKDAACLNIRQKMLPISTRSQPMSRPMAKIASDFSAKSSPAKSA